MSQRKGRGFAGMDPARQREIASMGGRAAHESGRAHEWDSQEARHAGHLGGLAAHHHRRAAFHHETAAHHHRQAAQNRITGDEKGASMHTTAAGLHASSAATAEKIAGDAKREEQMDPTRAARPAREEGEKENWDETGRSWPVAADAFDAARARQTARDDRFS